MWDGGKFADDTKSSLPELLQAMNRDQSEIKIEAGESYIYESKFGYVEQRSFKSNKNYQS